MYGHEQASFTSGGTYDRFAKRPNIVAVDKETIHFASPSSTVLDVATGTGAMIELLFQEGIIDSSGTAYGIDVNEKDLKKAKMKFLENPNVHFKNGQAEQLPFSDETFNLITFCNSIHLTSPQRSLAEAHRVLQKDGTLIINTAYTKDFAYPNHEAIRHMQKLLIGAKRKLKNDGYDETGQGIDLLKYTSKEYLDFLKESGFSNIQTRFVEVKMDKGDVVAICDYDDFAKGAFPAVPVEQGRKALVASAEDLFKTLGENATISRGWVIFKATKS